MSDLTQNDLRKLASAGVGWAINELRKFNTNHNEKGQFAASASMAEHLQSSHSTVFPQMDQGALHGSLHNGHEGTNAGNPTHHHVESGTGYSARTHSIRGFTVHAPDGAKIGSVERGDNRGAAVHIARDENGKRIGPNRGSPESAHNAVVGHYKGTDYEDHDKVGMPLSGGPAEGSHSGSSPHHVSDVTHGHPVHPEDTGGPPLAHHGPHGPDANLPHHASDITHGHPVHSGDTGGPPLSHHGPHGPSMSREEETAHMSLKELQDHRFSSPEAVHEFDEGLGAVGDVHVSNAHSAANHEAYGEAAEHLDRASRVFHRSGDHKGSSLAARVAGHMRHAAGSMLHQVEEGARNFAETTVPEARMAHIVDRHFSNTGLA